MSNIKALEPSEAIKIKAEMVELKVDGSRINWTGTDFISERLCVRNDRYSHVCDELKHIDAKVTGEIAIPGSHVLHLNKKENWPKARFYMFDVEEYKGKDVSGEDPKRIRQIIDEILRPRWKNLRSCRRFPDFKTGWDYVEKELAAGRYAEGIIIRDSNSREYKIKKLTEAKLPIVGYEKGALKGAFQIMMPKGQVGKVSGTSVAFLAKYEAMLAANETPYAEIEYQFLTDDGIPFQPRLRRLDTIDNLKS